MRARMNLQTPQSESYRIQGLSEAPLELVDPRNWGRVHAVQDGQVQRGQVTEEDEREEPLDAARPARGDPLDRRARGLDQLGGQLDALPDARMLLLVLEEDRGERGLPPAAD